MGGNISFIDESREFLRDVWEMDFVTGEWTMLFSFDSEPLSNRFKGMFSNFATIFPCCWLVAREMLLFSLECGQRRWIAYNVETREIQSFELEGDGRKYCSFEPHVNSLVDWNDDLKLRKRTNSKTVLYLRCNSKRGTSVVINLIIGRI